MSEEKNKTISYKKYILIYLTEICIVFALYHDSVKSFVSSFFTSKYSIVVLIIALLELIVCILYYKRKKNINIILFLALIYTFEIIGFTVVSNAFNTTLYGKGLFDLISTDVYNLSFFSNLAIFFYLIVKEKV